MEELRQHGFLATLDKPVPETPKFEDLSRLTYLQNVIKEAQRLYPVGLYPSQDSCSELLFVADQQQRAPHVVNQAHQQFIHFSAA